MKILPFISSLLLHFSIIWMCSNIQINTSKKYQAFDIQVQIVDIEPLKSLEKLEPIQFERVALPQPTEAAEIIDDIPIIDILVISNLSYISNVPSNLDKIDIQIDDTDNPEPVIDWIPYWLSIRDKIYSNLTYPPNTSISTSIILNLVIDTNGIVRVLNKPSNRFIENSINAVQKIEKIDITNNTPIYAELPIYFTTK